MTVPVYHQIDGQLVEPQAISSDRTFRNAWALGNDRVIEVDMEKARGIQKALIRVERDKAFQQLDTAYMMADEKGKATDKAAIAAQKQVLRDLPADPRITAASTPEELKVLTFETLTK